MQTRRTFFGALAGLAALVPVPAFAWSRHGALTGLGEEGQPLPEFYHATWDTDFLELPQDIHIYQWDQPMVLRGETHQVRRIKITVPGERLDLPVMFNLPEHQVAPGVVYAKGRRIILPAFEEEGGFILGEEHVGEPDPDVLPDRMAAVMDAVAISGFDAVPGPIADGHPMWITLHQHGQRVRHMMASTPYQLDAEHMLLVLPAGRSTTRIIREPPSPHDVGEDGPWKAV